MNPVLDDATLSEKLAALGFVLIRVMLCAVAWVCFVGLFRALGPAAKPSTNDPVWVYAFLSAIGGAMLTVKYFEDLIFASRHRFQVFRWFDAGLRRPMRRFVPTLVGTFIGSNIVPVIEGNYWRLLGIFPWTILWVALGAGYSPVLIRLRKMRKLVAQ
ncbi:MAG: hypothetical protein QE269_04410 [Fimbriimonas sp.]|nr:hypothetical protein [Fimbriimonas sp.]